MKKQNIHITFILFTMFGVFQSFYVEDNMQMQDAVAMDSLMVYHGQNPAIVARQKNPPFAGYYQVISTGIDSVFTEVSGKNEMAILIKDDTLVILRDWNFLREGYKTTVSEVKKNYPGYRVVENDCDVPYYFLMYSKLDSICFDYGDEDSAQSIELSDAIIQDTTFSYGPAKVGMDRQTLSRNLGIELEAYPPIRVIILPHYYRVTLKRHPLKRTYYLRPLPPLSLYSIVIGDKVEQILISPGIRRIKPNFDSVHR